MTPEELANHCADYARENSVIGIGAADRVAEACAGRIREAAAKYQVAPDVQGFELATVGTMLAGLREEVLDQINYLAMVEELVRRLLGSEEAVPGEDLYGSLVEDLRSQTSRAVEAAALMDAYVDEMVRLGLYERRPEGQYEDMLRAEQVEASIAAQGLSPAGLNHHDG